MAVRPFLITSSKNRVGFLNRTAVRALPTAMLGAGGEGSVQPLDRHEIAALIDHGEHTRGSQPPGLRGRGRDHGLAPRRG